MIDLDRLNNRMDAEKWAHPEMVEAYAAMEGGSSAVASSVSESIEPATIIFATLPILVVYPFVQRYFVAGVTIGAVKG